MSLGPQRGASGSGIRPAGAADQVVPVLLHRPHIARGTIPDWRRSPQRSEACPQTLHLERRGAGRAPALRTGDGRRPRSIRAGPGTWPIERSRSLEGLMQRGLHDRSGPNEGWGRCIRSEREMCRSGLLPAPAWGGLPSRPAPPPPDLPRSGSKLHHIHRGPLQTQGIFGVEHQGQLRRAGPACAGIEDGRILQRLRGPASAIQWEAQGRGL